MSGRRSSRKTRKNPPVSVQPQQPPQAEEEVEEGGPSLAELTVPPPPKDGRGKEREKKGKARDKRKRRDSHEDSDAEEVQSEAAQEEPDSEDEAESEVPVTEKKVRRAKAPAVILTPEQEEDISEWLKQNPWLWDRNEKDYRLRDSKQGGYNDKAAEMGLNAKELRRRIKTLKYIAVKALKPLPSGAGGRIRTPQQQRCLDLFDFLAKKVVRRPGRTTLKGVQPKPLVQVQAVQEEVEEEEEGMDEESMIELTGDIPPPQPRRRDRWRKAASKEHDDLLEAMRRSLADSSAITQRVESALGTSAPPPTDPRLLERHTYGQWFMSILPSIADDHWFAFRRDINLIVDHFQAISVASQRPAAQSAQTPQTAQPGMALFHAMDQPATQTSQQKQQFFKPPSTSQFVSTPTSSTSCEQMPDWQRNYQRADQDFIFPEGQTTFTPAQLSNLPAPHQVTRIVRVQQVSQAQQQQQLVVPGRLPQQTFAQLRPVSVPTATATAASAAAALSSSPAVRPERSQSAPNMQSSMNLGWNTPVFFGTPAASPVPVPSHQSMEVGESFSSLLNDLE